jgi:hypothetical protein
MRVVIFKSSSLPLCHFGEIDRLVWVAIAIAIVIFVVIVASIASFAFFIFFFLIFFVFVILVSFLACDLNLLAFSVLVTIVSHGLITKTHSLVSSVAISGVTKLVVVVVVVVLNDLGSRCSRYWLGPDWFGNSDGWRSYIHIDVSLGILLTLSVNIHLIVIIFLHLDLCLIFLFFIFIGA